MIRPLSTNLRGLNFIIAIVIMASQRPEVLGAELQAATVEAYSRYVNATEARVARELARPGTFLYIDGVPTQHRAQIRMELKSGQIHLERLETKDASGREIDVPEALIHHWIGDVFIPGATVKQAIEMAQDYARHEDIYKPEVVRSRLLGHDGNDFKVFYRLRKHKVITVTLNTVHQVRYSQVDATHWHSRSAATRIAEVDNADGPAEREKPVGQDGGFLWRIDSWWRWEERDGVVYVECESVSLTRDIPTGLGWLIKPFVTSIPRESLEGTLGSTRSALLARINAAHKH